MTYYPVFHIGYHKTGTSYLQKKVLDRFPEHFLRVDRRSIFEHAIFPNSLEKPLPRLKQFISKQQAQARAHRIPAIFSCERLSGGPHSGGYDSLEIAHRIQKSAPNSKIFIVIREQESMIRSCHAQFVRAYGSLSLEEYIDLPRPHRNQHFRLSFLQYDQLISAYQSLFGIENVCVLPYEMLRTDREEFVRKFISFVGKADCIPTVLSSLTDEMTNRSAKPLQQLAERYVNPFSKPNNPTLGKTFYSTVGRLLGRGLVRATGSLPTGIIDKHLERTAKETINRIVGSYFENSNDRTSALTGARLEKYGYRVSKRDDACGT